MDDDNPVMMWAVLTMIGFPWSVLVLLDQMGLLDPILRAVGV
jgi:hypothetical protein